MPRAALSWVLGGVAVLFFVQCGKLGAQSNAPIASVQEWQTVLDALRAENRKQQAVIGQLQATIAATKAENELLRQQWELAQLRAQRLGANPSDGESRRANQELAEAIRRLSLAEVGEQRLARQLQELVTALKRSGDVAAALQASEKLLAAPGEGGEAGTNDQRRLGSATVVDVNSALLAVVLNVGARQGVRVGMPFLVFRGDRVVAALRVVEVRPEISGALIEHLEKGVALRTGDGAQVTQTTGAEMREARPASEKEILWKSKR